MTIKEFIKHINNLRKQKKDGWYTFTGTIEGKAIVIKGYNTWLQVYKVNGINHAGPMAQSVREFLYTLRKGISND